MNFGTITSPSPPVAAKIFGKIKRSDFITRSLRLYIDYGGSIIVYSSAIHHGVVCTP